MKVKLIRRGKLAGLVTPNFHRPIEPQEPSIWETLELPSLTT